MYIQADYMPCGHFITRASLCAYRILHMLLVLAVADLYLQDPREWRAEEEI